ncbi:YhgE/Pip domain-containing protein, partial [Bacillus atrophaeus]|nr:YhgE/Pip domain-containing protein [Bacillus atrophaeus]
KNQNAQVKQIIESSTILTKEQKEALSKQIDQKVEEVKLPELDRLKEQIPDVGKLPDLTAIKQKLQELKKLPSGVNQLYTGSVKIQNGL